MKTYLDCIPCFLQQVLEAARFVTSDEEEQEKVMRAVLAALQECDFKCTPPEIAHKAHFTAIEALGVYDPYNEVKKKSNTMVATMYTELERDITASDDPATMAVRLAIAGNIMDCAPRQGFDIRKTVAAVKTSKIAVDHTQSLKRDLKNAKIIAYVADNAGEIVFDKLFIETMESLYSTKEWHVYVRGRPIINDATVEDATQVGLHTLDTVTIKRLDMDKEYDSRTDPHVLDSFKKADVVISKGQGNYEILSNATGINFYFLLMVKCPVVADDVGVSVGDIVVINKKN